MVSVDHYMNQIDRGFNCGYLRVGSDPDWGVGAERQMIWELKIDPIRYPDPADYQKSIQRTKERAGQRKFYAMGIPVWTEIVFSTERWIENK